MPDANMELAHPRTRMLRYLKVSPLAALLRLSPWLAGRTFCFQATERLLEYPFIHEQIPPGRGRCLDVGSGSSLLPLELASKGYQVWAIDLKRAYSRFVGVRNFVSVQGDIRETHFPDAFFDIATAVSSIEHLGLGTATPDFKADRVAVGEILRILKPSGRLLMTVPFGKSGLWRDRGVPQFRVYESSSLGELLDGFLVDTMEFGILDEGGWRPASLEEAEATDSVSQVVWHCSKAVAMIAARRVADPGETRPYGTRVQATASPEDGL